jgi:hypothetical protein
MLGRFDYVKYDEQATADQADFKTAFEAIETMIEKRLRIGGERAKALALTNLEQAYMWIGKAIRDGQITRDGDAADQPERG